MRVLLTKFSGLTLLALILAIDNALVFSVTL